MCSPVLGVCEAGVAGGWRWRVGLVQDKADRTAGWVGCGAGFTRLDPAQPAAMNGGGQSDPTLQCQSGIFCSFHSTVGYWMFQSMTFLAK